MLRLRGRTTVIDVYAKVDSFPKFILQNEASKGDGNGAACVLVHA